MREDQNQDKPPQKVGNYYNKLSKTLPDSFYQNIIELENDIQMTSNPSLNTIRELGALYKKAIESFSCVSPQKVEFYSNKLSKLLVASNKLTSKKKPTKWSKYMETHKKNTHKFMLFLQIDQMKKDAFNILDSREKVFSDGFKEIENELDEQQKKFYEKKNSKKIMNISKLNSQTTMEGRLSIINENSLLNIGPKDHISKRNDKIDKSVVDFMKKFHYIYLHSKILETSIEKLNEIYEKVFLHKIDKYYYYQDQIKQFQMLMNDDEGEEDENKDNEEMNEMIKNSENERKAYYIMLNGMIQNNSDKIKNICSSAKIEEDKHVNKYFDELMDNISKIFI